jgi:hypothetical protein
VQVVNHSSDVQVTACVAPNNAPCQTFSLYATPASLWTLVTVSGSTQVVVDGHSFQPLIMRVTDGSTAANPVMGVTVAFNTTVVRIPPGSQPRTEGDSVVLGTGSTIVLGTSSVQAITTSDGIASIVPSRGAVSGACDLFITVNAGSATIEFHLQIVAQVREDASNAGFFLGSRRAALQASGSPGVLLFAVPEGISSVGAPADLHQNACLESSSSGETDPSERRNPRCTKTNPEAPKVRRKPRLRTKAEVTAVHPAKTDPHPGSRAPLDKRSCRVLAEDRILP